MPRYSLALFDCDGTIADTDRLILETFIELYKKYRPDKKIIPEEIYYFSGPPIRKTLQEQFPLLDIQNILDEYHEIASKKYVTCLSNYPHVIEVLKKLKSNGVKLGVITNKLHKTTLYCLQLLKMNDVFDIIIGSDDVIEGKPNVEAMNKAMNFFQIFDKRNIVYIGDNIIDRDFAFNAGVDSIILTWGPRKANYEHHQPTYFAKDFIEVERIILDDQ